MRTFSVIILVFWSTCSIAQGERWWNELHYFGTQSTDQSSLWGDIDYRLTSNRLHNDLMEQAFFQGAISSETSDYLIEAPADGMTSLEGGVSGNVWLRLNRPDKLSWNIGIGAFDVGFGRFSNGLTQLYLNGNGPFEDQTMQLGPSWLRYMSGQTIGVGFEKNSNRITWGLGLNLVKVSRYQNLNVGTSSLYTAPNGTSLEASLAFDLRTSRSGTPKLSSWYGTGASLNAFAVFRSEDQRTLFSLQASNIGMAHFSGIRSFEYDSDTLFSGVKVDDILSIQDELSGETNIDSVEALIGLEASNSPTLVSLPGHVQLDFVRRLGDRSSLAIQIKQMILPMLPQFRVGYHLQLFQGLGAEPYVRFGGMTRFDYGLALSSQPFSFLQLFVRYELFESQIMGDQTTSQAFRAGGQILF